MNIIPGSHENTVVRSILKRKAMRSYVWRIGGGVGVVMLAGAVWRLVAQSVPDPALTISVLGTNQLQLKITNGVGYANYEIHRRIIFDPAYPWTLHLIGNLGQTNFTADMGIDTSGFFRATSGLDWDLDGVPNWLDGNPSDTNVGVLSITIDSPLHGTIFN